MPLSATQNERISPELALKGCWQAQLLGSARQRQPDSCTNSGRAEQLAPGNIGSQRCHVGVPQNRLSIELCPNIA